MKNKILENIKTIFYALIPSTVTMLYALAYSAYNEPKDIKADELRSSSTAK